MKQSLNKQIVLVNNHRDWQTEYQQRYRMVARIKTEDQTQKDWDSDLQYQKTTQNQEQ